MGDHILSWDEHSQAIVNAEVTASLPHTDVLVDALFSDGRELRVTTDHHFLNDQGWAELGDSFDSGVLVADSSVIEPVSFDWSSEASEQAWDLSIAVTNNYLVGGDSPADALIAHNTTDFCNLPVGDAFAIIGNNLPVDELAGLSEVLAVLDDPALVDEILDVIAEQVLIDASRALDLTQFVGSNRGWVLTAARGGTAAELLRASVEAPGLRTLSADAIGNLSGLDDFAAQLPRAIDAVNAGGGENLFRHPALDRILPRIQAEQLDAALIETGLATRFEFRSLDETYQVYRSTVGDGSFDDIADMTDWFDEGRRWDDVTARWKGIRAGEPRFSAERLSDARATIISRIDPPAGPAVPDFPVSRSSATEFPPDATGRTDIRAISNHAENTVNATLPASRGKEVTFEVTIQRPDGTIETFEIRADFITLRDGPDGPELVYHEVKASINGMPDFSSLTPNQKIWLEAFLEDPGSVTTIPKGTNWDDFVVANDLQSLATPPMIASLETQFIDYSAVAPPKP